MSLLEIRNYTLSFFIDNVMYETLHNISLTIEKNKIIALVGESGCGKTMTAMSILKLLPKNTVINEGEIIFDGTDILTLPDKQLQKIRGNEIALIPQDPMTSLNPLYTIGNQLLEIIKKNKSISDVDAKKKAIEVLDIVKIPNSKDKLNLYPYEFSGGMKQRIIIAMALATNAKLIIADEPTTALDVTIQAQIMNLMYEIKSNTDTSILLISHELNLVGQYADKINVMYSGSIVEKTASQEFFNNTLHPYSKGLLKSLPSNNINNKRINTINGQPPLITDNITGCPFNTRCSEKIDICNKICPELKEITTNHYVACNLY